MADVLGRFAPSPTGRMHLGNIAAAVAAWAASQGNMLLRIEDIDTPRVRNDADKWIMDDLHWLGLQWIGEPVYQSQRLDYYEEALRMLPVYPCTCSRRQIRAVAAPQEGDGTVLYPGTCRPHGTELTDMCSAGIQLSEVWNQHGSHSRYSWRLALPQADDPQGIVRFNDMYCGPQCVDLPRDIGDSVMRRSDGIIAYHLAVTVDDAVQGVTQIVRGRDLLRSAGLQLYIRHILQRSGMIEVSPDPQFAHIGIMRADNGVRMAKRLNSIDMGEIRASGVHPGQVLAWIAAQYGVYDDACRHSDDIRKSHVLSPKRLQQIWNSAQHTRFSRDVIVKYDQLVN